MQTVCNITTVCVEKDEKKEGRRKAYLIVFKKRKKVQFHIENVVIVFNPPMQLATMSWVQLPSSLFSSKL